MDQFLDQTFLFVAAYPETEAESYVTQTVSLWVTFSGISPTPH